MLRIQILMKNQPKYKKNNSSKTIIYGQLIYIYIYNKRKENSMINKKEELDNNKEISKLLKENSTKMEIAKEIQSNKKISEIVGDRLARKRHFPPC